MDMAILKNKTQGNFVMISRNITKNKKLGLTERGLLLTLLSLSDGWEFSIEGICKILPDGKSKISTALKNLMALGYITKEQSRDDKGVFGSNIIEVHDVPIDDEDNPIYSKPLSDNPSTVNSSQYNITTDTKINNKRNKECEVDSLSDSEYKHLIEEFGKEAVDYQIHRINIKHYKGCMNYQTIAAWCDERRTRKLPKVISFKGNRFIHGFQGRNYTEEDFKRMEEAFSCGKE